MLRNTAKAGDSDLEDQLASMRPELGAPEYALTTEEKNKSAKASMRPELGAPEYLALDRYRDEDWRLQ